MRIVSSFIFGLILLTTFSCTHESETPYIHNNENEVYVTFTIQVPGQNTPTTYSMDGAAENNVSTIDILAFRIDESDNNKAKFSYRCEATNIITNDGEKINEKSFQVSLLKSTEKYEFVILTNAKSELDGLSEIAKDADKEKLLNRLIVKNTLKWNTTSGTDFTPIPMWGQTNPLAITDDTKKIEDVKLLRMLARIDVAITEEEARNNFALSSVHIYNRKSRGHLVPKDENLVENSKEKVASATIPTDNDSSDPLTIKEPLVYEKNEDYHVSFFRDIYLFESEAPITGESSDATCIVVGGKYKDETTPTYYRLDFFGDDKKTYRDILRNHLYKVNIVKVNGSGWNTPDEAFESKSFNMEAEIVIWNEGEMEDIVFDGQYMLGISPTEHYFSKEEKEGNVFHVTTDYPKGWKIVNITDLPDTEGNAISWIKDISGSFTSVNKKDTVRFSIEENTTGHDRTAYLFIMAGRLTNMVTIYQSKEGKLSLSISPEDVLIFPSGLYEYDPITEEIVYIEWGPESVKGYVDMNPLTHNGINFASSLPTILEGGTASLLLTPEPMTEAEVLHDPFREKIADLEVNVTDKFGQSIVKSLKIKQINYEALYSQPLDTYILDESIGTLQVFSNTPWTATVEGDAISELVVSSGQGDIYGEPLEFKMTQGNENFLLGESVITIKSIEDKFEKKEILIKGIHGFPYSIGEKEYICYYKDLDGILTWVVATNTPDNIFEMSEPPYSGSQIFPPHERSCAALPTNNPYKLWRVPNQTEMYDLFNHIFNVDEDSEKYNITPSIYWTSSSFAERAAFSYNTNFVLGGYDKTRPLFARCIRDR